MMKVTATGYSSCPVPETHPRSRTNRYHGDYARERPDLEAFKQGLRESG